MGGGGLNGYRRAGDWYGMFHVQRRDWGARAFSGITVRSS